MKTPEQMLEALGQPFPANAVEQRQGAGGRMFQYVAAETVIRRLNSATNGEWSFIVDGHEWRGDVLITWGALTIPGLGTRSGFGVQTVSANAGEDIIKGSASDCLKKCATQFGVALELYGPDLEAGELPTQPRPPQRAQNAPNRPSMGSGTGDLASDAQRGKIRFLAKQAGMLPSALDTFIRQEIHPEATVDTLFKRDASKVIDALSGMPPQPAQQMEGLNPTDAELAASNPDRFRN